MIIHKCLVNERAMRVLRWLSGKFEHAWPDRNWRNAFESLYLRDCALGRVALYEIFFRGNRVTGFMPLDISITRHNISNFYLNFWCSNWADFRTFSLVLPVTLRAKVSDEYFKYIVCNTNTHRSTNTIPFPGKYFVIDDTFFTKKNYALYSGH